MSPNYECFMRGSVSATIILLSVGTHIKIHTLEPTNNWLLFVKKINSLSDIAYGPWNDRLKMARTIIEISTHIDPAKSAASEVCLYFHCILNIQI